MAIKCIHIHCLVCCKIIKYGASTETLEQICTLLTQSACLTFTVMVHTTELNHN